MIKKFLFALIPLLCFLFLVEGTLHLFGLGQPVVYEFKAENTHHHDPFDIFEPNPHTGLKMKPRARYMASRLNSLGFRDEELNHKAKFKILSLGDSTTFGWGIWSGKVMTFSGLAPSPGDASNFKIIYKDYSRVLENRLNDLIKPTSGRSKSVEVFNAGTPAFSVFQGLQLYEHYLKDIARWDYVIISFGLNLKILTDNALYITNMEYQDNPFLLIRGHLKRTRVYNFLRQTFYDLKNPDLSHDFINELYKTIFRQLVERCLEKGSRVIIMPVLVRPEEQDELWFKRMLFLNILTRSFSRIKGVDYVDTTETFRQHAGEIGWKDPYHYDETGHALIGETLFDFFRDRLR